MEKYELARKALEKVDNQSFYCNLSASEGGHCGNGWTDGENLDLDKDELLYLINQRVGHPEVFEGMKLKKINIDNILYDMAKEGSWPEGINSYVHSAIPDELEDIAEELENLDLKDKNAVEEMRKRIQEIPDDYYTFHLNVYSNDYEFTDDGEVQLYLTAQEAIGLLYGEYNYKDVFKGICKKRLSEDFINDKAEKENVAEDYDEYSYSGECFGVNNYLDAWDTIFEKIFSGEITEDNLSKWLEFFDDEENYSDEYATLERWLEYQEIE